jgi:hypothetical protein
MNKIYLYDKTAMGWLEESFTTKKDARSFLRKEGFRRDRRSMNLLEDWHKGDRMVILTNQGPLMKLRANNDQH